MLFKLVETQRECSKPEQRPVINFSVAEKSKLCEMYRRLCDVYGETGFSKRNIYEWSKNVSTSTYLDQKDSPWIGNKLTQR